MLVRAKALASVGHLARLGVNMITSKKTPEGEIVQTMELRGYDSVELWRAVFAHCSELETYLRQNRHHLQKGAIESVQARIDTYQKLLKDLNVLSNQVE